MGATGGKPNIPTTSSIVAVVDKYQKKTEMLSNTRVNSFNKYLINEVYLKCLKYVKKGKFTVIDNDTIEVKRNIHVFDQLTKKNGYWYHDTCGDIFNGKLEDYFKQLIHEKFPQSPQIKEFKILYMYYSKYDIVMRFDLEICIAD